MTSDAKGGWMCNSSRNTFLTAAPWSPSPASIDTTPTMAHVTNVATLHTAMGKCARVNGHFKTDALASVLTVGVGVRHAAGLINDVKISNTIASIDYTN